MLNLELFFGGVRLHGSLILIAPALPAVIALSSGPDFEVISYAAPRDHYN